MSHPHFHRSLISLAVASACAALGAPAAAQRAPAAADPGGQVIEVTGIRASLGKAVELKREAIGVRDSIVAEDIGKFPDANIAEALGKLPGVEVIRDPNSNEGQSVRLRGLGVNQTLTTLNGAVVRTTATGKIGLGLREFSYDIFPSELLGRADVIKTPMAELQEGGVGGVIDLQTPRPFDRRGQQIRYTLSAGQNSNDDAINPRGSLFYSNTWGDFGALVSVAASKAINGNAGAMNSTGQYVAKQFNPTAFGGDNTNTASVVWNTTTASGTGGLSLAQLNSGFLPRLIRVFGQENVRERVGLNTSFQYKDAKWDVSLDSLYANMTDDAKDYFTHWSVGDSTGAGRGLVPIDVSLDANNNIKGKIGNFVQSTFSRTFLNESKFSYNALNAAYKVSDTMRVKAQLAAAQDDAWRNTALLTANGDASVALRQTLTVDFLDPLKPKISSSRSLLDPTNQNNYAYSGSYLEENDKQKLGSLVGEYDWNLGKVDGRFKAGWSFTESTKGVTQLNAPNVLNNFVIPGLNKTFAAATAAEKATYMQSQATPNPIQALTKISGSDFPSQFLVFDSPFVLGQLNALAQNKASAVVAPSTYSNTETSNAFFAQSDMETQLIGRTLRANVGVRMVETTVDSDTVRQSTAGTWVPITTHAKYTDTLPSVSLAYDLSNKLVWRGAWGKTLTPNRVSDIAQALRLPNNALFAVTAGNPDLQPERATGTDTALEWYPDKNSVASLGYFERKISGEALNVTKQVPFSSLGLDVALWQVAQQAELIANPNKLIDLTFKINNPNAYKVSGLEFQYSQAFNFLPEPFNGLGGTVSYTKVDVTGVNKVIGGQNVSLPRLPPTSYSLTGYYERGPFSARVSFTHKDAFANTGSNDMNAVGFQRWFNARDYVDFTIGYKVLKNIELRMDLINLTQTKTFEYFKSYGAIAGKYGDDNSRVESAFAAGRTVQLTLRGSF